MAYTNSPLVVYTKISPNHSGQRTHSIDRITPHCVVGQCSAESLGSLFADPARQASSNYGIDKDGRVGMYCPESNRSWCTSNRENDQRAITVECASDTAHPYAMNDAVYKWCGAYTICTSVERAAQPSPIPSMQKVTETGWVTRGDPTESSTSSTMRNTWAMR